MFRFSRSTVHPIGIDVAPDCVRMLQLEQAGSRVWVRAHARIALPTERATATLEVTALAAAAVRDVLSRRSSAFRGRRVIAAVPHDLLHVRNLRLPGASVDAFATALQAEIKTALPFSDEPANVHCLPAGETRQGGQQFQEVIVLGARKSEIDAFLEAFKPSRLSFEAIDLEPCARYRAVERFADRRDDGTRVIADVGPRRTQVIIGRGADVGFIKSIDVGFRHFEAAITRKLGLTGDEIKLLSRRFAAARPGEPFDPVRQAVTDATRGLMEGLGHEIGLCLRYHSVTFRGPQPAVVTLTGDGADDPQLRVVLSRVLQMPVEPVTGFPVVDITALGTESPASWTCALGLASKNLHLASPVIAPRSVAKAA